MFLVRIYKIYQNSQQTIFTYLVRSDTDCGGQKIYKQNLASQSIPQLTEIVTV